MQGTPQSTRLHLAASVFLDRFHTDEEIEAFFDEPAHLPAKRLEFYAVDWSTRTHRNPDVSLLFVIGGEVANHECTQVWYCRADGTPLEWGYECTCGRNNEPCAHVQRVGLESIEQARLGRLTFDGLRPAIGSPPSRHGKNDTLTAAFLKRVLAQSPPQQAERITKIALQLASEARGGRLVLAPVTMRMKGRSKSAEVRLLRDLDRDAGYAQVSPGERLWLRLLLAFPDAGTGGIFRTLLSPVHSAILAEFADAGRLLSPSGIPVRYSHSALSHICKWEFVSEVQQKLICKIPHPVAWLSRDMGVAYVSEHENILDFGVSHERLQALNSWPPLSIEDREEVLKLWHRDRFLSMLPAPPSIQTLPIREIEVEWQARFSLGESQDYTGLPSIDVDFVQVADGVVWNGNTTLEKGEREWIRYKELSSVPLETALTLLTSDGFSATGREAVTCTLYTEHCLYRSIARALRALSRAQIAIHSWGDVPRHELVCNGEIVPPEMPLTLTRAASGFKLDLSLRFGGVEANVQHALSHREPYSEVTEYGYRQPVVRLSKGKLAFTTQEWASTALVASDILSTCGRDGTSYVASKGALLHLSQEHPGVFKPFPEVREIEESTRRVLDSKDVQGPATVDGIDTVVFAPFQSSAVNWLLTLREEGFGGLLADDRGLGKTLEALGAIVQRRNLALASGLRPPPAVVVIERKEMDGWSRHLNTYLRSVKWHWQYGTKRRRSADELRDEDIVLTTYGLLIRDLELYRSLQPEFLFLDEAKAVKNSSSARFRSASHFIGTSVIPITGTPIDRNISDLWALLQLAVPDLNGREKDFKRRFKAITQLDDPARKEAHLKLLSTWRPFLRRVTKADVGTQMPPKRQLVQPVTMDDAGANAYESLRSRLQLDAAECTVGLPWHQARIKIEPIIRQLRLKCAKVGPSNSLTDKGQYLLSMVQDLLDADHRVLVFSHHNSVVTEIVRMFQDKKIRVAAYLGSEDPKRRDVAKNLFKDRLVDVLVLSQWGASGLDLAEADTVIISDAWFSLTHEDQMGDRAHRWISPKEVTVFRLALAGTIEEVAIEIADRHGTSVDSLFKGEGISEVQLTRADYDRMLGVTPVER